MPVRAYLVCFWPGLPQLWYRGIWQGLVPAVLFAAFINLLLVARLVYPQWLSPVAVRIGCWLLVALWLASSVRAIRGLPHLLAPRLASGCEDLFPAAQENFLAGRWFEAERLLRRGLEVDPRDAPAWLLLAAVYRVTERRDKAWEALVRLRCLESGGPWWMEIAAEERRLKSAAGDEDEAAEPKSPVGENGCEEDPVDTAGCRNGTAPKQVEGVAT